MSESEERNSDITNEQEQSDAADSQDEGEEKQNEDVFEEDDQEDDLPPSNLRGNMGLLLVLLAAVVVIFIIVKVAGSGKGKTAGTLQDELDKWKKVPPESVVEGILNKEDEKQPAEQPRKELTWKERIKYEQTMAFATSAFVRGSKGRYIIGRPAIPRRDGTMLNIMLFDISKLTEGVSAQDMVPTFLSKDQALYADTVPILGLNEKQMPKMIGATAARILNSDRVIGLKIGNEARAYPVKIMNRHWVIHDTLGGKGIVLSWNALARSATCFERVLDKEPIGWRFAGRVYRGFYCYYSKDGSLWDSRSGMALSGSMAGKRLKPVDVMLTTWQLWLSRNPGSKCLSTDTGWPDMTSAYGTDELVEKMGYLSSELLFFTVPGYDPEKRLMSAKEPVLGLCKGANALAVTFSELKAKGAPLKIEFAGAPLTVNFDAENATAWVEGERPDGLEVYTMLWYAWKSAFPNTAVYGQKKDEAQAEPKNGGK